MTAPPNESNGYLKVRCNGGLNQQRSAVSISYISWTLVLFMHSQLFVSSKMGVQIWVENHATYVLKTGVFHFCIAWLDC